MISRHKQTRWTRQTISMKICVRGIRLYSTGVMVEMENQHQAMALRCREMEWRRGRQWRRHWRMAQNCRGRRAWIRLRMADGGRWVDPTSCTYYPLIITYPFWLMVHQDEQMIHLNRTVQVSGWLCYQKKPIAPSSRRSLMRSRTSTEDIYTNNNQRRKEMRKKKNKRQMKYFISKRRRKETNNWNQLITKWWGEKQG